MASITDEDAKLALLIEQNPGLPLVFTTEEWVDRGHAQYTYDSRVETGVELQGEWYTSASQIHNAYYYWDMPDEVGDDYEWWFDHYSHPAIHVIISDKEED